MPSAFVKKRVRFKRQGTPPRTAVSYEFEKKRLCAIVLDKKKTRITISGRTLCGGQLKITHAPMGTNRPWNPREVSFRTHRREHRVCGVGHDGEPHESGKKRSGTWQRKRKRRISSGTKVRRSWFLSRLNREEELVDLPLPSHPTHSHLHHLPHPHPHPPPAAPSLSPDHSSALLLPLPSSPPTPRSPWPHNETLVNTCFVVHDPRSVPILGAFNKHLCKKQSWREL